MSILVTEVEGLEYEVVHEFLGEEQQRIEISASNGIQVVSYNPNDLENLPRQLSSFGIAL